MHPTAHYHQSGSRVFNLKGNNMIKTLTLFALFSILISAQTETKKPCSSPETRQFDFWLGDWNAIWTDNDGRQQTGSNHVINLFNGCTIEENFNGEPGTPLIGKSFSVYDSRGKIWKQTWVDNQGSYLDFTGKFKDGKMILTREFTTNKGNSIKQRMTYFNITKNDFDWNWEISKDNGKTWELKWKIHYERK
jgi:hypothetical protein